MLTLISPAKSLDWSPVAIEPTTPVFLREARSLAKVSRQLSAAQLKSLMGISDDLAQLNHDRFKAFKANPDQSVTKPAVYAFNGDTYQGFDVKSLDEGSLLWAQDHLRILSGLYGLLRPLDAIQPYRLEMGSRLKTAAGKNLYEFWGDKIANAVNKEAQDRGIDTLVNCASEEYFKAASRKVLAVNVVTPVFMEVKAGKPKIVSFYAKKARGAMARFICENRILEPQDIRSFDVGGYRFEPALSEENRPFFLRDDPVID